MDDKLFLIAIGGTGMRCLESFVHLCAAGLFDNKTIEILTLDTDQNNGNKGRVEELIDLYNRVKTHDAGVGDGGQARAHTFFSAKLNLYSYHPNYAATGRNTMARLADTPGENADKRQDDQDIADLLFDRDTVQTFNLERGYRAQTHLGSLLMYHGIVEAALHAQQGRDVSDAEKALRDFVLKLNRATGGARVFVFGSVFGGTGASSIPVIPMALRKAVNILSAGANELNPKTVKFGSTLLTDYFSFKNPDKRQKEADRVIANSDNFALNSQAALTFYNGDSTVQRSYKRLYHIGWPNSLRANFSESQATEEVITGGQEQKNPCHVAELMCAAAAYDFFTIPSVDADKAQYLFRTVSTYEGSDALNLSGSSFVGSKDGGNFENKLGALTSLAHIILSRFQGGIENGAGTNSFLDIIDKNKLSDYNEIPEAQGDELDEYLRMFAYKIVDGKFIPGWLYQVKESLKGGTLLFNEEAFLTTPNELRKVDAGNIFIDSQHTWEKKGLFGSDATRRFDKFMDIMLNTEPDDDQGGTLKEKFLGHLYNAFTTAQNFSNDD